MIKNISLSLSALLILVGCDGNIESTNDYEAIAVHNQGSQCLTCHGIGASQSNEKLLTSGATVYSTINGSSSDAYATNYTIRLILENTGTEVNYVKGYGTGNSNTNYSSGSINTYTAKVLDNNGSIVNSSLVNSHNVARLDCNACHTATGTNGAPGRITSFDYATQNTATNIPTTVSFTSNVMPVLESKCKSCHGDNGDFTITDTTSTYTNISTNNFINTSSIDISLLLTKAKGISHGGGTIISTTSTEYITIKDWITQGALNN